MPTDRKVVINITTISTFVNNYLKKKRKLAIFAKITQNNKTSHTI